MTFGQRLKMLRQERGLSQEEMGRAVGVSSRVIGYYEADERFPKSRETLIAFAEAFSVSLDYLLDNPVKSSETGCPARFCYMKSMNSEQREAVNDFIGYLRYRSRKEEEIAREAEGKVNPYVEADLSPDIVEMLENWYDKDEDEEAPAENTTPAEAQAAAVTAEEEFDGKDAAEEEAVGEELSEEETAEKEAFAKAFFEDEAEEEIHEEEPAADAPADNVPVEEPEAFGDEAFADALPLTPAPEESFAEFEEPAPAANVDNEIEHIPDSDLSDFVFEEPIPDVSIDSTYTLPKGDFRRFFDNDFFVDDFFGDDTQDK